jgi:hypothetical protein
VWWSAVPVSVWPVIGFLSWFLCSGMVALFWCATVALGVFFSCAVALTLGVALVWNGGSYAQFGGSVFWVVMEVLIVRQWLWWWFVAPATVLVSNIWCFGCCRWCFNLFIYFLKKRKEK